MAYNQQKNKSNERNEEMTRKRELADEYLKIAHCICQNAQEYFKNYKG